MRTRKRRGTAVVELAALLPILVLLSLGAIESGRAVMVQHALQEAAQAACRVYSVRDTTKQDALDIVSAAMSSAGLSSYTVAFNPSTKAGMNVYMEPVSVTISVQYSNVAWFLPDFMTSSMIVGRCIMPADIRD